MSWYSYSSPPLCDTQRIMALTLAYQGKVSYSRDHDTSVHADVGTAVVEVADKVGDDVLEDEDSLRVSYCAGRPELLILTKLPARPPAMRATPRKSTTRARHAAGPSLPHESPENTLCRCDLSRRAVTR